MRFVLQYLLKVVKNNAFSRGSFLVQVLVEVYYQAEIYGVPIGPSRPLDLSTSRPLVWPNIFPGFQDSCAMQ